MTSYRVRYTEIVPGGHEYSQDESVRGDLGQVEAYLLRRDVVPGSVRVTCYVGSDAVGYDIDASKLVTWQDVERERDAWEDAEYARLEASS